MTPEEIIKLSGQFWNMSGPANELIKSQFPDADFHYAGTTITGTRDINFFIRFKSSQLFDPWILGIHIFTTDSGYLFSCDVVEEESGNIWWQCDSMRGNIDESDMYICFMSGALLSGISASIKRWKEHSGNCQSLMLHMIMDS